MENAFCPNCGNSFNDDDIFCSKCGKEIHHEEPMCPQCGEKIIGDPMFCSKCGAQLKNEKKAYEKPANELPMNWYKFLIYVSCFLSVASLVIEGFMMLTGSDNEFKYYLYPDLKNVNVFFSLLYLAIAAWIVVIRNNLAAFKKGSPDSYIICSIVYSIVYLLYSLIACGITHADATEDVMIVVVMGVEVYLESVYFKKRKHLFIND